MEETMKNALFYLFSAIAQTYGAILGIMGMLAVYRLGVLREVRRGCLERLRPHLKELFHTQKAWAWDSDQTIKEWEKAFPFGEKGMSSRDSQACYLLGLPDILTLKKNIEQGREVRNSFFVFLSVHLPIILLALIFLIFVEFISEYWKQIFGIVFSVLCLSAYFITDFCKKILSSE